MELRLRRPLRTLPGRRVMSVLCWLVLSSCLITARAELATAPWAKAAGGSSFDSATAISLDSDGNCYVTGYFGGTASFGAISVTGEGTAADVFVAKYNNSGAIQWVRKAGGPGVDIANGIAVDADGNCYVTGYFNNTAIFSGTNLTSSGAADVFLAKYNRDGALQWVQKGGGTDADAALGVAVDRAGNSLVTGSFKGSSTFGKQSVVSAGEEDIFVAKFNSSGAIQWIQKAGGTGPDVGNSIALDQQGRCYVAGRFRGTASFQGKSLTSRGADDIFVAKFDSAGTVQWAMAAGGEAIDSASGVATDLKGDCFVTGFFTRNATFGNKALDASGEGDIFVSKYSSAGQLQWVNRIGGFGHDEGRAVATDTNGNCYVTGFFRESASVGGSVLSAVGSWDAFFAGYGTSGDLQWSKAGGGLANDGSTAIAAGPPGTFYAAGYFGYPSDAPATFYGTNLRNSGSADVFVTKATETLPVTFSLEVFADAGGTVVRSPNQLVYLTNTAVVLTAVANPGFAFAGWSGDAVGSTNPLRVVMDSPKFIAATFDLAPLEILIDGLGKVEKSPDLSRYELGEEITLTAKPGRWHQFSRWGDRVTTNPRTITFSTNSSYRAVFTPTIPVETLEFEKVSRIAPVGMPAIFIDGKFVVTNEVIVVAPAEVRIQSSFTNGTLFYALEGPVDALPFTPYPGPFMVTNSTVIRTIAVSADLSKSVEGDPIQLLRQPAFSLIAEASGGGTVTLDPANGPYLSNSVVSAAAKPGPGWTFLHWSGDALGSEAVLRLKMDRDRSLRSTFATTVRTTTAGEGSVLSAPASGPFPYGSVVRLSAFPKAGYYFAFWGNAAQGNANPLYFLVTNSNPTIAALFLPLSAGQLNLDLFASGNGRVAKVPQANVYSNGQQVTLTATPDAGEAFIGWSDPIYGTQNPLVITLTKSTALTAWFSQEGQLSIGRSALSEPNAYLLKVTGAPTKSFFLQSSTNLADWITIGYATGSGESFPITLGPSNRFFRALPGSTAP